MNLSNTPRSELKLLNKIQLSKDKVINAPGKGITKGNQSLVTPKSCNSSGHRTFQTSATKL